MKTISFEEYVKDEIKSKVYNALEDVASEFPELSDEFHKKCMEEAIEWFMIHYYNL